MYLIYYDGQPLHDTRIDGCAVTSATCDLEVNTSGTLKFTIAPGHPLFDALAAMSSEHELVLEEDGYEWFRGRITNPGDEEMNTSRTVTAAGQLSYLNDSIVRPYGTYADTSDKPGWTTIAPGDAHGLAEWYIEQHNGQTDRSKQFEIGDNQLTVTSAPRSSTQWPTTGSELKDKLLDSLPCYIRARYESGKRYIDFSDDGWSTCQQRIEFGRNLTDFASVVDASGVITCIIPEGKDADGNTFGIASVADGTVADGCTKQGDHIISVDGVNRYGLVCEHRPYDDCTTTDGLIAACCADLQTAHKVVESLTIKAVDLHKVDPDIKPIHLGDWVRVTSAPHGVDTIIMCMQVSIDIGDPASTTYTFGAILPTLTRSTVAAASEQRKAIADVVESVEPISAEAKAAAQAAGEASATATEAKTTATSAKSVAGAAQTAAESASSAASTAQTTADNAATAATEAKTTATSAKSAADTATTVAGAAQTAAESASSAASTAQTTADNAATAASTAQATATDAKTTADTANVAAAEAKTTATTVSQHFWADDDGAHISTGEHDLTGSNALLTDTELQFRSGSVVNGGYGKTGLYVSDGSSEYFRAGLFAGWTVSQSISLKEVSVKSGEYTLTGQLEHTCDDASTIKFTDFDTGLEIAFDSVSLNDKTLTVTNSIGPVDCLATYATQDKTPFFTRGTRSGVSGTYSVADGASVEASGAYSEAHGIGAVASGKCSVAHGDSTVASGLCASASGMGSTATGKMSEAHGHGTIAGGIYQTVIGKYNVEDRDPLSVDSGEYAFIIGNGVSETARSNALTVAWDGTISTEAYPKKVADIGDIGQLYIVSNKVYLARIIIYMGSGISVGSYERLSTFTIPGGVVAAYEQSAPLMVERNTAGMRALVSGSTIVVDNISGGTISVSGAAYITGQLIFIAE